jgi:hypothetical protein
MDAAALKTSLGAPAPPTGVSVSLQALWQAAKGDWDAAHGLAQSDQTPAGAWVHAHLHRIEGDLPNAGYWYQRAGRPVSDADLDSEWADIVNELG